MLSICASVRSLRPSFFCFMFSFARVLEDFVQDKSVKVCVHPCLGWNLTLLIVSLEM
jgi:hypothetical protein